MTEDKNIKNNLREAIHREELSRPPMPKDLNARLMQRVEKEVNSKPKRKHIVWPWIAAACVAAIIAIYLTPPKADVIGEGGAEIVKVEKDTIRQHLQPTVNDTPQPLIANTQCEQSGKKEIQAPVIKSKDPLLTRTGCTEHEEAECKVVPEFPTQVQKDIAVVDNPTATPTASSTVKPRVLSERDIPITRPENLKYTKEELALMKKQANEAYIKWIELELEIARYNQEQTAQK